MGWSPNPAPGYYGLVDKPGNRYHGLVAKLRVQDTMGWSLNPALRYYGLVDKPGNTKLIDIIVWSLSPGPRYHGLVAKPGSEIPWVGR